VDVRVVRADVHELLRFPDRNSSASVFNLFNPGRAVEAVGIVDALPVLLPVVNRSSNASHDVGHCHVRNL